mgnify:FL=1
MAYLTYDEYIQLGFAEIEKTEFDRLLPKASDVINSVTRDFYVFNDIEDDVPFRRERFKKAVAAQIEYFHDMGATSSHGLNEPSTVTIGRTTVSRGYRGGSQEDAQANIVSDDAFMYLSGTGLLYRGVRVV